MEREESNVYFLITLFFLKKSSLNIVLNILVIRLFINFWPFFCFNFVFLLLARAKNDKIYLLTVLNMTFGLLKFITFCMTSSIFPFSRDKQVHVLSILVWKEITQASRVTICLFHRFYKYFNISMVVDWEGKDTSSKL